MARPYEARPSIFSIEERLRRALAQSGTPSEGGVPIAGSLVSSAQFERTVINMLARRYEWLAAVPSFQDVQNWVEVHWDIERQTQLPVGTVSSGDEWETHGEVQLDALTTKLPPQLFGHLCCLA